MRPAQITAVLHSRSFAFAASTLAFVAIVWYFILNGNAGALEESGPAFPSAASWIAPGLLNFICALVCSAATILIVQFINKEHNVMRALTYMCVPIFLALQLATPGVMAQFSTGTLLAVVVPVCMYLLFHCYRDVDATRQVFLIFLLLSSFTATRYCYAIYLPAMLIGCAQMRIFNLRTMLAALMGIATPWIIFFGFGIVEPGQIRQPEIKSVFSIFDVEELLRLLPSLATVVIMLLCYTLSVFKTIAYNARARAFNGAFAVVMLFTLLAMFVDAARLTDYIPLLNYCAAMEITHCFATHRTDKSFIAIIPIYAIYLALFICQTILFE